MQTWLDAYAKGYWARARMVLDKVETGPPTMTSSVVSWRRRPRMMALLSRCSLSPLAYDAHVAGRAESSPGMMSKILW